MKRYFPVISQVAVISLLLGVIWLSPSSAAEVPEINWLSELTSGSLVSPRALDVDGQGNLYVADQRGARGVLKFDSYGRHVATLAAGQASGKGVAVTPDGQTLYVSTKDQGVAIVNVADGTVSGYLSGATWGVPGEIDLDAGGYIFVADTGAAQTNVKIFFPNGTLKSVFGGVGTANGQFRQIAALTVNPQTERVYVASSLAEVPRLQIFDLNGTYLSSVANATLYGTDNHAARGIAFEESAGGRAFVLRYLPVALRRFDGAFATAPADFGAGNLTAPVDVAYDPTTKRLFVSDGAGIDIFGVDGGTSPVQVNIAPTDPVPASPVAGTVVASKTPTLTWSTSDDSNGDVVTYSVIVKQGDAVIYSSATEATSLVVPVDKLVENGSYVWTVQASDGRASSAVSGAAAFVVNAVDEAPTAPALVAPLAGEKLGDDGELSWGTSTDPDPTDANLVYQVEIATLNTFRRPPVKQTVAGTSVKLTDLADYAKLEAGKSYFWRVTALDGDGTASAPSNIGSFVYDVMLLRVVANVADAKVYLHGNHGFAGQFIGVAPLELRNLPAGNYSVVVERPGFDAAVRQAVLVEGASATVTANLLPAVVQTRFASGTINGSVLTVATKAAPFLVDFDNDGQLDLLVGDSTGKLNLFPAMAKQSVNALTFQAPRDLPGLPVLPGAMPFVADWDNDGRKDLLAGLADGTVKLFLNSGTETAPVFGVAQDLTAGGGVLSVESGASPAVVDLNGDGAKDLVVGNAAGNVSVFYNQGSDAAPQLAAGVALFQVAGAAKITPVDWDADGDRDLLVTVAGVPAVYSNELATANAFTAAGNLPFAAVFGVAVAGLNGVKGEDLILGLAGGKVIYRRSTSTVYADAFVDFLLTEWDEIALLVAAAKPEAIPQADKVRTELVAGTYTVAKQSAQTLVGMLPAGDARVAVAAFAALIK